MAMVPLDIKVEREEQGDEERGAEGCRGDDDGIARGCYMRSIALCCHY